MDIINAGVVMLLGRWMAEMIRLTLEHPVSARVRPCDDIALITPNLEKCPVTPVRNSRVAFRFAAYISSRPSGTGVCLMVRVKRMATKLSLLLLTWVSLRWCLSLW